MSFNSYENTCFPNTTLSGAEERMSRREVTVREDRKNSARDGGYLGTWSNGRKKTGEVWSQLDSVVEIKFSPWDLTQSDCALCAFCIDTARRNRVRKRETRVVISAQNTSFRRQGINGIQKVEYLLRDFEAREPRDGGARISTRLLEALPVFPLLHWQPGPPSPCPRGIGGF